MALDDPCLRIGGQILDLVAYAVAAACRGHGEGSADQNFVVAAEINAVGVQIVILDSAAELVDVHLILVELRELNAGQAETVGVIVEITVDRGQIVVDIHIRLVYELVTGLSGIVIAVGIYGHPPGRGFCGYGGFGRIRNIIHVNEREAAW